MEAGLKIKARRRKTLKEIWKVREFYLFLVPAIVFTVIFSYIPMSGVLMAFQNIRLGQDFLSGTWIGLDNFTRLFKSSTFLMTLGNTLTINFSRLLLCIPLPIILAVLIHNCSTKPLRRIAQTASYIPHLLSAVVVVSIINLFCNGEFGLVNILRAAMGTEKIAFFGETRWVLPLYVISEIWQHTGYSAVIYLAALSSIDPALVEAATIDGASKLQRIWYIDIQCIRPTIITLIILSIGHIMTMDIDKILLLQTNLNLRASETIGTYVYKTGIISAQYSFSTAVGLFNNVCNLAVLIAANFLSRRFAKNSLF